MLSLAGAAASSMSKAGLEQSPPRHGGEISHKHGNALVGQLRKIYGQSFGRRVSRDQQRTRPE
jgi:hypothetical protein